jgi:hypothetical protein
VCATVRTRELAGQGIDLDRRPSTGCFAPHLVHGDLMASTEYGCVQITGRSKDHVLGKHLVQNFISQAQSHSSLRGNGHSERTLRCARLRHIRCALICSVLKRVCVRVARVALVVLCCAGVPHVGAERAQPRADGRGACGNPPRATCYSTVQHAAHGTARVCVLQAIMNYELPLFHQNGAKIEVRTVGK